MKTARFILAGLLLCCLDSEAVLSGSDDFNDDIRDTDKWLIWELGDSLLHETNGRLEFTSTGTGYEQDAWIWDYNTGSYSQNWSVILDVRNAASPPVSPQPLALGLHVANSTDHGDTFGVILMAQASDRIVSSGWRINGVNYWPTLSTNHLVATNAARLRLSFDSSTKLLSTAYDIGVGFTALATFDTGNWALNSNDTFTVAIKGQSDTYAVSSGQVYADNFIIVPAGSGGPDTHYVDWASPSPTAPYTSWTTAATNIQDAVDVSADGDTVLVADGHYILSSEILITNEIAVSSVNGPETTIVDGVGTNRCFHLRTNACSISGFTVTNGFPSSAVIPQGGGILCWESNDGLLVRPGLAAVSNCVVVNNSAVWGGGIYGGTINNCIISGNTSTSSLYIAFGGGIFGGSARNCIITGNSAAYGGGLNYTVAENCVISGNTATEESGGIRRGSAINCTITGNNAAENGGGTYQTTVTNSIIWYNSSGMAGDNNFESILAYSCSPVATNGLTGNITNAPFFADSLNGDYRLTADSPCVDTGNNSSVSFSADLDGHPRIIDGTVDMGAYESGFQGCFITNFFVTGSQAVLEWTAFPMWESEVRWTTNLTNGFLALETGLDYPLNSYTDTMHSGESSGFYEVEVRMK